MEGPQAVKGKRQNLSSADVCFTNCTRPQPVRAYEIDLWSGRPHDATKELEIPATLCGRIVAKTRAQCRESLGIKLEAKAQRRRTATWK